jgi:hypothetical protein
MTGEETTQIRTILRKAPRTVWGYWPFVFPVLFAVVGAAIVVGLVIYWETKMPDLEVLFRRGTKVAPIADSQSVREAVMLTAMSITITFVLLAFLARLAFRQVRLLRAAARDLGIEDGQPDGAGNSRQAEQLTRP